MVGFLEKSLSGMRVSSPICNLRLNYTRIFLYKNQTARGRKSPRRFVSLICDLRAAFFAALHFAVFAFDGFAAGLSARCAAISAESASTTVTTKAAARRWRACARIRGLTEFHQGLLELIHLALDGVHVASLHYIAEGVDFALDIHARIGGNFVAEVVQEFLGLVHGRVRLVADFDFFL